MHLCSEFSQHEVLEEMLKIGCDNLDAKDLVTIIMKTNIC